MEKKYLRFAVLETLIITLPLGIVLFLVFPSHSDSDMNFLLWGCFSAAVAGLAPFLFRALLPTLMGNLPSADAARVDRLAGMAFYGTFVVLVSLWGTLLNPYPSWGLWVRVLFVPAFAAVGVLCVRFIYLPSHWRSYRNSAEKAGIVFVGSVWDLHFRPQYHDEDVRWLAHLLWERLTNAYSRRAKR